jgi:hypothetical protein
MKSIINASTRENFYIRLYFNANKEFKLAGIRRAYLDFSRTLFREKETVKERKTKRAETEMFILEKLEKIIKVSINNQAEFDIKHKELTKNLVNYWNKLSIGQAQKWINMSLKYWLLFGNERVHSIEKNAKYFHIPIDRFIQEKMFPDLKHSAWSKIELYSEYFKYQTNYREKSNEIPIVAEFQLFNNS